MILTGVCSGMVFDQVSALITTANHGRANLTKAQV